MCNYILSSSSLSTSQYFFCSFSLSLSSSLPYSFTIISSAIFFFRLRSSGWHNWCGVDDDFFPRCSLVLSSGEIFLCVKHSFLLVNKAEHHFLMYLTLNNNPSRHSTTHPRPFVPQQRVGRSWWWFLLASRCGRQWKKNLIIFIQIFLINSLNLSDEQAPLATAAVCINMLMMMEEV